MKNTVAAATNQPNKQTKELTELAVPALTTSLWLVTDTLNYNWDCAYANDFLSQLNTLTWANGGQVAQEEIGIVRGRYFGWKVSRNWNAEWSRTS
jgi:hypothetical protein